MQQAQLGVRSPSDAAARAGELPAVRQATRAAGSAVIVEREKYRPGPPPPPQPHPPMGGSGGDARSLKPTLRASGASPPAGRPRPNPRSKLYC
jgi:hypothetical protein